MQAISAVVDPTITNNVTSAMGEEVTTYAFADTNVTITPNTNVTVNDAENSKGLTETAGSEAYFFEVKANDGYQITKVEATAKGLASEQEKTAALATDATEDAQKIASEVSGEYTKYTIPLNDTALGDGFAYADLTGLTVTVTAEEIPASYTVTLPTADEAHATVAITSGATDEGGVKKTDASEDIVFTVTASAGYQLKEVAYTVDEGNPEPLTANDEGNYIISKEKITGDITISVKTAKEIKISFSNYNAASSHYKIYAVTKDQTAGYVKGTEMTGTFLPALEKEDAYFLVKANEMYRIADVTDTPKDSLRRVSTLDGGTVYRLSAAKAVADVTATVKLAVDTRTAYQATFELAEDSEDKYTISTDGTEEDTKAGKINVYTAKASINLTVKPDTGYGVTKVEKLKTPATADTEAEYEDITNTATDGAGGAKVIAAAFTAEAKTAVYRITVAAKVLTAAGGKVTFTKTDAAEELELEVKTETNKVEKTEDEGEVYQIKSGAQYLEFTLTAGSAKVVPVVKVGETEWPSKTAASPFTYKVSADLLKTDTTITIDQKAAMKALTIEANNEQIDFAGIVVQKKEFYDQEDSENGCFEAIEINETGEDGCLVYQIPVDTDIVVTIPARRSCAIKNYKINGGAAKTVNGNTAEIGLKIAADTNIAVTSESQQTPVLAKGSSAIYGSNFVPKGTDGYAVEYNETYAAAILDGPDGSVDLAKATLEGKNLVTNQPEVSGNDAVFTIAAADAGKKLTLKLFDDAAATRPVATFTLNVKKAITKVTVPGLKNGKLTQSVDTNLDYAITADADISNLALDIKWADDASNDDKQAFAASLANGKLTITTKTAKDADAVAALNASAAKATIRFADTTKGEKNGDNYPDEAIVAGSAFTLVIAEPEALEKVTPTVTQKFADDVKITLTLGVPAKAKIDKPAQGKLWYEVTVAPKTGTAEEIAAATTCHYFAKEDTATQDETIQVIEAAFGSGMKKEFAVTAKLVQTINQFDLADTAAQDYETGKAAALTTFASKPFKTLNAATKEPYYETKLSLKKGTTTVYTGQTKVKIATLSFGKNTTYTQETGMTAEDITNIAAGSKIPNDKLVVKEGAVWLSIPQVEDDYSSVAPGKHTIRVTAVSPDHTYKTFADIVVTVNRGIEKLSLTAASDTIYKATNKKATLKVTPVYNEGNAKNVKEAKTKKVKDYVLVAADTTDAENPVPKQNDDGDVVLNVTGLTVKNGTVTVDAKKFDLAAATTAGNNKFFVRATAADWNGNPTVGYSEMITITGDSVKLGKVLIVRPKENDPDKYVPVIDGNEQSVTSWEFGLLAEGRYDAVVKVLKPGTELKTDADYEDNDFVDATYLTFKSSNAKSLGVGKDGQITAVKTGKNIKITVTTNDGGKQSATLEKIEIANAKPAELGLKVENVINDIEDGSAVTRYEELNAGNYGSSTPTDVRFTGTSNSVLRLTVVRKENDADWHAMDEFSDLKVAIKNATVLNKVSAYNEEYTVIANKAAATVTLTYTNKESAKTTRTFNLINQGVNNLKAPGVKANKNLVAGPYSGAQEIKYTLNTKGNNYDYKGKVVVVKADAKDRSNKKNTERYEKLESQGNVNNWVGIEDDGTFTLSFNKASWEADESIWGTDIPAGSYKLNLTFGTLDSNGDVIPDTKAVNVTLKAAAPKALKSSYKPVSTVKMSVYDTAAGKTLAGSGKNIDTEEYSNLLNANITGQANHFRDLFELDSNNVLKLKSTFSSELKAALKKTNAITEETDAAVLAYITASKAAKNDRIGFVDYNVYGLDDKNYTGTTKITVAFDNKKSTDAYSLTAVTILQGTDTATVQVLKNKKTGASIADAYVLSSDKNSGFTANVTPSDKITLALNDTTKNTPNKYKVTIAVVPENNYYKTAIENAKNEWETAKTQNNEQAAADKKAAYEALLNAHGVKLTANVTVGAKGKTGNKITVAKNLLKQTFTAYYDERSGVESGYHGPDQNYWIKVPYTKNMECGIASITSSDTAYAGTEQGRKNLINFDEMTENGRDYINICLNKDDLEKAVAAGKVKYKKGKASLNVTATVHFGEWVTGDEGGSWVTDADNDGKDDIKSETFKFTLTMPAQPTENSTYEKGVEAVQAAVSTISKNAVPADWKWNGEGLPLPSAVSGEITLKNTGDNAEAFYKLNELVCNVRDEITKIAPEDADVKIVMPQEAVRDDTENCDKMELAENDFTAPTTAQPGTFKVKATLYDATTLDENGNVIGEGGQGTASVKTDVEFTLTIPALKEKPTDIESTLRSFVSTKAADENYIAYLKDDGGAQLAKDARKAVGITDDSGTPISSLRLNVEDWDYDAASSAGTGSITGKLHVWGYRYGGEECRVDFSFTIKQLEDLTNTVTLVDTAVKALAATNAITKAEVLKAANDAIRNPDYAAVWQKAGDDTLKDSQDENKKVEDADGDVYKLVKADRTKAGYVIGTIVVEDSTDENATNNTVNVNLPITQLTTDADAVKAVKAAVAIDAENGDVVKDADMKTLILENGNALATVKTAILEAANEAVAEDGFKVAYKKNGRNELFAFTPAKYKATGTEGEAGYSDGKGSISFTLVLTDTLKETDAELAATVEIPANNAYKFGPFAELQTLADAKADVAAALATLKTGVSNSTNQTVVENAVNPAVTGTGLTVAVEDFEKNAATIKAKGKISCAVKITKAAAGNVAAKTESIPFEAEIAKLTQTLADAKTAAQNVLNTMTALTNDAIETTGEGEDAKDVVKADVLSDIEEAVKNVVDTDAFTVAIDDADGAVTAQKATTETAGSIKITVKITEKKENDPQSETVDKIWTIAKLEAETPPVEG